jgi:N-acetylmuramoyl-L-alanine amidase
VRAEILDTQGLPLRDSLWVRFTADARGTMPRDTLALARDGVAWAYFRVAANTWPATLRVALAPQATATHGRAAIVMSLRSRQPRPRDRAIGFALRMPEGVPLAGAPGTREPRPPDAWLNRDGFAVCRRDASGSVPLPRLDGYRVWPSDQAWPPRFTAIAGGVLHGRRIVLDPDGGGDVDGGTGPSGTRAANLNLDVARALAGLLGAAGADVALTRSGDLAMSDVERVQISEAFHADRFVRIGHRSERPMVGYYFSSAPGRRWAERTARALASLGAGAPAIAEDAQYPLQQTSCPALYVSPARIDDAANEQRLAGPGAARTEAYAIYLALIGEWSDATMPFDSLAVRDPAGHPASGAIVSFGESTLLQAGADGVVRFARTEPGPIGVEVAHPRVHTRRVLLDSESGMILTGTETR